MHALVHIMLNSNFVNTYKRYIYHNCLVEVCQLYWSIRLVCLLYTNYSFAVATWIFCCCCCPLYFMDRHLVSYVNKHALIFAFATQIKSVHKKVRRQLMLTQLRALLPECSFLYFHAYSWNVCCSLKMWVACYDHKFYLCTSDQNSFICIQNDCHNAINIFLNVTSNVGVMSTNFLFFFNFLSTFVLRVAAKTIKKATVSVLVQNK